MVHAGEGPAQDPRRVRAMPRLGIAAGGGGCPAVGRAGETQELLDETALADAGLAGDDDHLAASEAGRLEGEIQPRELHPAADQRRAHLDADAVPALGAER